MTIQLINDLAIKWIANPIIEKIRLSMIHTNIKSNHAFCKGLRYDIYNNEMKKEKEGNGHMTWQWNGHSDVFLAGYWKRPVKGGTVLFMTDVTVFYVTMLRIIINHVFLYMLKNRWTSV